MLVVINNRPRIRGIEGLDFFPGVNFISDEQEKQLKAKNSKVFENELKTMEFDTRIPMMEKVDVQLKKGSPTPSDIAEAVTAMAVPDAKKVIKKLYLVPQLRKILAVESRVPISAAAQAQLDFMLAPSKKEQGTPVGSMQMTHENLGDFK